MHPPRHLGLGKALLLHCGFHLPGENALDGGRRDFLVDALLAEPAVERRSDVFLLHAPPSRFRFSARPISRCEVFWVFLMKPCSSIMRPSSTQKRTRAIRPRGKLLRTSHNSRAQRTNEWHADRP